jgi:broad specificity phosphatase PhoE
MSLLVTIRHGQASLQSEDYDQLTPRGVEQSRQLGAHWAESNLIFDQVYVGPRRRHRETQDAVAAVYRERGLNWPEPVELPELDEHSGQDVLSHSLPDLMQRDPALREIKERLRTDDSGAAQADYLRLFQKVTRLWARRELRLPDLESWHVFRDRVRRGFAKMTQSAGSKKKVAAFSSGGPMAAAVGVALNLDDEKTLELSWVVRNGAYTEFLFSGERFSLVTFNAVPHLTSPNLLTFI